MYMFFVVMFFGNFQYRKSHIKMQIMQMQMEINYSILLYSFQQPTGSILLQTRGTDRNGVLKMVIYQYVNAEESYVT